MSEIRIVTTLRRKRDEISASIRIYEKRIAQARSDLAHVTAAIRIFEASGSPKDMDLGDTVLAQRIGNRLIHSLRMQEQRGRVKPDGKRHGVSIWRLPTP